MIVVFGPFLDIDHDKDVKVTDKCGILIDFFVLVYVSTVVVGISVVCAGY